MEKKQNNGNVWLKKEIFENVRLGLDARCIVIYQMLDEKRYYAYCANYGVQAVDPTELPALNNYSIRCSDKDIATCLGCSGKSDRLMKKLLDQMVYFGLIEVSIKYSKTAKRSHRYVKLLKNVRWSK